MHEFKCKISYDECPVKNTVKIDELSPLTCFKDQAGSLWMALGSLGGSLKLAPNARYSRAAVNLNTGSVGTFACHIEVRPYESSLKIRKARTFPSLPKSDEVIDDEDFLDKIKNFDIEENCKKLGPYSRTTGGKSPFILQNRYQDSGWETFEENNVSLNDALIRAKRFSENAICYGMVRVVGADGIVVQTYSGGRISS